MNSNERLPAEAETQKKYEDTVLDFLDKEMANVQETQQKNKQSDELDALVTDLLKQVITEADQGQANDKPLFDEDELFSGMAAGKAQASVNLSAGKHPTEKTAEKELSSPQTVPVPAPEEVKAAETPKAAGQLQNPATTAAVFGSKVTPQKKFPVLPIALAGIVLIVAVAAYFFSSSSPKAPINAESQPAVATQLPAPPVQTTSAPAAAASIKTEQPSSSAARVAPANTKQADAPASASHSRPNAQPVGAQPVTQHAVGNAKSEPAPAAPVKSPVEEKPVIAAQPIQTSVQAANNNERPSLPPAPEHSAPAAPPVQEKKPTPQPQLSSISEPPAPQPVHTAAAPNLVSAVPIMQAGPVYPELAMRAKLSGSVVLELQINDQGKVVKATPVSGPAVFHSAAIAAVMKWRYKPASIGGVNVSSQSRVTMAFKMKN